MAPPSDGLPPLHRAGPLPEEALPWAERTHIIEPMRAEQARLWARHNAPGAWAGEEYIRLACAGLLRVAAEAVEPDVDVDLSAVGGGEVR